MHFSSHRVGLLFKKEKARHFSVSSLLQMARCFLCSDYGSAIVSQCVPWPFAVVSLAGTSHRQVLSQPLLCVHLTKFLLCARPVSVMSSDNSMCHRRSIFIVYRRGNMRTRDNPKRLSGSCYANALADSHGSPMTSCICSMPEHFSRLSGWPVSSC